MKGARTIGMIFLGIWILVTGIVAILPVLSITLSIPYLNVIMAVIAIIAGVFILIGRKD